MLGNDAGVRKSEMKRKEEYPGVCVSSTAINLVSRKQRNRSG